MRRSLGLMALLPLVAAPTCAQRFDPPATGAGQAAEGATTRKTGEHPNAVETNAITWHGSFNEAMDAAKANGKKVLIDIYAPWCPWCRRMQEEVYPVGTVRSEVAQYYEAVRLNGEDTSRTIRFTPPGREEMMLSPAELAAGLGAQGYPTVAFMTGEGGYITRVPGFADAVTFRRALRFVGTDAYKTQQFESFEPAPAAPIASPDSSSPSPR